MAATTIVLGFFLAAVAIGFSGGAIIVAQNVTLNFTCTAPNGRILPTWFVNGRTVLTNGYSYRSIINTGRELTATLIIDGNHISDTLNIHCEVYMAERQEFLPMHNTTLTIQGHLPTPKNVHINSSAIQWKPPYSSLNNDTMHVDPHITQYTVYIFDNYTGNIVKKSVRETQYAFNIQDDGLCPMYQVSAWNAGGEGELSDPVQDSTSQVPHHVTSVTAEVTVEPNVLYIHIDNVDVVCTNRMPEFFLITLMTSTGRILIELNMTHQLGQENANFTISLESLHKYVDICTTVVRITAGNSAGMSGPSEPVEVVCSDVPAPTVTTTTSTVSTGSDAITSAAITSAAITSADQHMQGNSSTLIVIIVGAIVAVGGVLIVAATVLVGYICYRKGKLKKHKVEIHFNQAYETVTRAPPATQVHTEPCPAYGAVVHAHH